MSEDYQAYADRVRRDHYAHWFALLAVAWWAKSVFSWPVGAGVLFGLIVVIWITNTIILATTGSLRAIKINRWGWLAVVFVTVIYMSATVGSLNT